MGNVKTRSRLWIPGAALLALAFFAAPAIAANTAVGPATVNDDAGPSAPDNNGLNYSCASNTVLVVSTGRCAYASGGIVDLPNNLGVGVPGVALSNQGNAYGNYAASASGDSRGGADGVSGTGGAYGYDLGVSGTGPADGYMVGVSGTGPAGGGGEGFFAGFVEVSGTGSSTDGDVTVSGTGPARTSGGVAAVSATGPASNTNGNVAVSGTCKASTGSGPLRVGVGPGIYCSS
jgi:hypothetical protein